jgi:molybdopterin-biosynthesis enzyme MoeA-like protein
MLDTVLSFLNPYRWLAYITGVAAVMGLLWYGVHSYNVSITKEAVATALAQERAAVKPAFDELEATIEERDLTIATIKAESDAERTRQQARLNIKTIEYKNALSKAATVQAKYDALLGTNAEFTSMLNAATANNNIASGASAGTRLKQLSEAHRECERNLRSSIEQTIATTDKLSKAVAVIESLKN